MQQRLKDDDVAREKREKELRNSLGQLDASFRSALLYAVAGENERTTVGLVDKAKCAFTVANALLHLNNVVYEDINVSLQKSQFRLVVMVNISGDRPVYGNKKNHTFFFDGEIGKTGRAWSFLYKNGCTSAKSAF